MADILRMIGTRIRSVSVHGLVAFVAVAAPLSAQVRVGGQGVYRSEILSSGYGVGARAELDLGFILRELGLGGVFNRFSVEGCADCSSWEAAGQVTLGEGVSYIGTNVLLSRIEQVESGEMTTSDEWKFSVVVGFRLLNVPVIVPFLKFGSRWDPACSTTRRSPWAF